MMENSRRSESPLQGESLPMKPELQFASLQDDPATPSAAQVTLEAVCPPRERTAGPASSPPPGREPQSVVSARATVSLLPRNSSLARPWPPSSSSVCKRTAEANARVFGSLWPRSPSCFATLQIQIIF